MVMNTSEHNKYYDKALDKRARTAWRRWCKKNNTMIHASVFDAYFYGSREEFLKAIALVFKEEWMNKEGLSEEEIAEKVKTWIELIKKIIRRWCKKNNTMIHASVFDAYKLRNTNVI